jgi:hypothetical protein
LLITRARLSGGVLRQAGKAASAEAMAASTVAWLASATLVADWPVAGLKTGCVRSVSATILPSIRWPMVVVTFLSWFMIISSKKCL